MPSGRYHIPLPLHKINTEIRWQEKKKKTINKR